MIKKGLIIFLFGLSISNLVAQDIHFSQFNRSFLNLNPALNGDFKGSYRFNGNYRNQWSSVSEPFTTFSFSAEAKSPFKKLKGIHLGLLFFNDEAGLGGLTTTLVNLNTAYSYALNSDSSLVATAGLQFGITSRSINFNAFRFDQQYDGVQFNPNLASGENFNTDSYRYFNLQTGFKLSYFIERRKRINAGIGLYNLTQANQSFLGSNIPLDQRSNFHIDIDYIISERIDILPSVLYSSQGNYNELVFGTNLRYRLENSDYYKRNLYGGVWLRNEDAFILFFGLDYNQWQVGASYDINTSGLDVASSNRGGLELSVSYILQTFKPTIRRYKRCPIFL